MEQAVLAALNELEDIVKIDSETIGDESRRKVLKEAIEEQRCLIVIVNGSVGGFLVYNTQFFDCSFISLVIVKPSERRKGIASSLIRGFEKISPTEKIFSSTNQSNEGMQKVFSKLGYEKCGWINNLDEGDPELIYFKNERKVDL
ncbi:GNAT family N-acetyltransferase [Alkalihalobacillus sp. AL-G]|uniref:GNAT family N-acetyltransferase n=1 Tax=Alkalihalobacillus sp. AL-G TaxID=2926399 RepID=UPI00272D293E|nr:GNAT family N-acetyltransferase [Alkalihalobacillus sp. AL-G]WLD94611.1 GNAT family N-acetyltransferase [Alkalihalobacillus sp. AL-G]